GTKEGSTVLEGHMDAHVLQEETASITEGVEGELELLEGLVIHEDVGAAIVVQVGHVTTVDGGGLNLDTGVPGLVDGLAGDDVLELGAHEGWALARLHVLELDDLLQLAVDLEDKAVLEISGGCHGDDLPCVWRQWVPHLRRRVDRDNRVGTE